MKQILSVFMKRLAIALGLAALMIGSLLLARGEGQLIGALFLGYFAALVFVWNMAWRLWRLTYMQSGGKRQMLWGMVLRMLVLFLVLLVAVTITGLRADGYDGETAAYIRALNGLNQRLYDRAAAAVAMKDGAPFAEKGDLDEII